MEWYEILITVLTALGVPGLIAAFTSYFKKKLEHIATESVGASKTLHNAILAMMRYEMLIIYKDANTRGEIHQVEMDVFESLYAAYHEAGGNGSMTALKEKIEELPIIWGDILC